MKVLWNCELKETFLPQTALIRVTNMFPLVDLHKRAKASSLSLILAIAQLLGLRPRATPRRSRTERITACALHIHNAMYLPHTDTDLLHIPVVTRTFSLIASTGTSGYFQAWDESTLRSEIIIFLSL